MNKQQALVGVAELAIRAGFKIQWIKFHEGPTPSSGTNLCGRVTQSGQSAAFARRRSRVQISPCPPFLAEIAKLVSRWIEDPDRIGSSPILGTILAGVVQWQNLWPITGVSLVRVQPPAPYSATR